MKKKTGEEVTSWKDMQEEDLDLIQVDLDGDAASELSLGDYFSKLSVDILGVLPPQR